MPRYNNKEELNKVINEGYFSKPTFEQISSREILLEKVLNIAKNNKDDIFRQIALLVEEVTEIEAANVTDVDAAIDNITQAENDKEYVIRDLPITTLAIKKLDAENIESLKWIVVKKLNGYTGVKEEQIFQLSDENFKKFLVDLLRADAKDTDLLDNEKSFVKDSIEDNTAQQLVESFVKYVGLAITEDADAKEDDNDYYYLVKKQLDMVLNGGNMDKVKSALEFAEAEVKDFDATELIDKVPEEIQAKVTTEFIKSGDIVDYEEDDNEEDLEFEALAEEDQELDTEQLTITEQLERQERILENLKELYIIKRTKEITMLENSKVLRDVDYKKRKLSRTLLFENAEKKEHNSEYGEKLTKIGILVESLFRKYASELTKD